MKQARLRRVRSRGESVRALVTSSVSASGSAHTNAT
jgi:hypothetical protein